MTAAALSLVGLTKRFGRVEALRDVSLDVRAGEFLVLVGPSGCGKSTLLRAIAGLEGLDEGEIRLDGRDIASAPPDRRDVAMVFQSYALFPHLTVRDNVAFGMRARKQPEHEIEARVGEVAEVLGLQGVLARRPRELSGGERQRVALARAMVRAPSLFLMDEPLSNLDAQLRVRTRAEIVSLQRRLGTTTLYVTHDQIEALSMGHRVAVMDAGRIRQVGTPDEVYADPADTFVATFVGSPPMNLLPARAEDGALRGTGWSARRPGATRDGDVVAGVRPEHVHVRGSRWSPQQAPADVARASVEVVESAGDQAYLVCDLAGAPLVARVEPSFRPAPGSIVEIWFDAAGIRLFDPATGVALGRERG